MNTRLSPSLNPTLRPCPRYYWRSLPLQQRSASQVFAALFKPQTPRPGWEGITTLLESPYPPPEEASFPDSLARFSICAGAPRVSEGQPQYWTPPLGQILPLLQQAAQWPAASHWGDPTEALPFTGGWLGWLGYDVAWEIERLPWLKEDPLPFPIAFWYEPAEFAVLDHQQQRLWLAAESAQRLTGLVERWQVEGEKIGQVDQGAPSEGAIPVGSLETAIATNSDLWGLKENSSSIYIDKKYKGVAEIGKARDPRQAGDRRHHHAPPSLGEGASCNLQFESDQVQFQQAVACIKGHIHAGDVFQVNHSLRFTAQTATSAWEIYRRLQQINPSPFASYWQTPWGSVVSCSPERLVHLQAGIAQSRPIAGTRPRGSNTAEDRLIAQELRQDTKERAEHIMLVDLERNDLGRVCQWGSVQVPELMTVERYSHVMHLVSNVEGRLSCDRTSADLIAALFPGGTITGCPKVRCMEIIESLEPVRRSLFYGSCGYLDRRGRLDLNILIRTLLLAPEVPGQQRAAWGQVGAGIVADSDPEREWWESLQKAKAQLLSLGL